MIDNRDDGSENRLDLARRLVAHLEQGQDDEASQVIYRLSAPFEREMFEELGKLTRDLHETLKSFRDDSRLLEITRDEIPDARERLNYVIAMTEQATHRTLNAVEEGLPIVEALYERLRALSPNWERFRKRTMSVDEFRDFARELDGFFADTAARIDQVRSLMSEILMAQDFQDLTGQIISRVIRLVQDVEQNLVGLVRLSSERFDAEPRGGLKAARPESQDTRGPCVPTTKDALADVVSGQDDVDDLLSSLGF